MNIITVTAIISFTVFFTGGTMKIVLDLLNKLFPKDKIFINPDELDNDSSDEDVSVDFQHEEYLEELEKHPVFNRFLIKNQAIDLVDPFGERFLEDADVSYFSLYNRLKLKTD